MDKIIEITENPNFGVVVLGVLIILLIVVIVDLIKTRSIAKKYKNFMNKLGKGSNLEGLMRDYIEEVEKVREENAELKKQYTMLEKNTMKCVQKIGLIRYNAFADTGSDLSFALAMLDYENNGIVINGLYSRDNATTTYSKPVVNGKSTYALSKEENEAIEKAKLSSSEYYINV